MSTQPEFRDRTLSMDAIWRVEEVCQRFEAALKKEDTPNIEEYLVATNPVVAPGQVWFVDVDNTAGPWDGRSWATAFEDVHQGAGAAAEAGGGELWVAEGTYTSTEALVVDLARIPAEVLACRRCHGSPLRDVGEDRAAVAQKLAGAVVAEFGDRASVDRGRLRLDVEGRAA